MAEKKHLPVRGGGGVRGSGRGGDWSVLSKYEEHADGGEIYEAWGGLGVHHNLRFLGQAVDDLEGVSEGRRFAAAGRACGAPWIVAGVTPGGHAGVVGESPPGVGGGIGGGAAGLTGGGARAHRPLGWPRQRHEGLDEGKPASPRTGFHSTRKRRASIPDEVAFFFFFFGKKEAVGGGSGIGRSSSVPGMRSGPAR